MVVCASGGGGFWLYFKWTGGVGYGGESHRRKVQAKRRVQDHYRLSQKDFLMNRLCISNLIDFVFPIFDFMC